MPVKTEQIRIITVLPGKTEKLNTDAGEILVIGGQDKFAVRRPKAGANVPDIIYQADESLIIHHDGTITRVEPFTPIKYEASPADAEG